MKKILFITILLAFTISVFAAPSIYTTSGALHAITAIDKASRLTLSLHSFATSRDFSSPYVLASGDTTMAWDTYAMGDVNFGIAYTFTKWLELSVSGKALIDAIKLDPDASERIKGNYASYGLGDTYIGVKLTSNGLFGSTDAADIGAYGFYSINTGKIPLPGYASASFNTITYNKKSGGIFRFFTSNSRDFGVIGLLSIKTKTQVPMMINLNGGYVKRMFNTKISVANYYVYNASFSVEFGTFVPFIEVYGNKFKNTNYFENKYILFAAGGVRFDTPAGLVIDIGSDFRVTHLANTLPDTMFTDPYYITLGYGAIPEWRIHLGLSYYYDFIKDLKYEIIKETKKTMITGKIVDALSGKPLSAQLTLPGYSEDVSIVTDSTGTYCIEVRPGTIRIKVTREGYKWVEKGIILEKGQTKIVDFVLNPKKKAIGTITGKVVNKSNQEIVIARISFPGTEIPAFTVDAGTGIYRIDLTPGTYSMAASSDGFVAWSQPVVIEQDKTLVQNIEMLKKGGTINLVGIYFDSGKASIKPSSYYALDQAVQMLIQNPNVKIEIQGHTDSVGNVSSNQLLSQARAEAVRNYLVAHGIEAWRIVAKGYGEIMPIAPNTSRDGRARNRRIEFLILGE